MERSTLILTTVAVLAMLPQAARGQEMEPDSAVIRAATRTLQSDLRNFVTVQERYFADRMRYASSLRDMAAMYRPSRGVTLVVLTSSATGHSEIAVDERVPGLVCAIFVGSAPAPLGRGEEGEVVCRGP